MSLLWGLRDGIDQISHLDCKSATYFFICSSKSSFVKTSLSCSMEVSLCFAPSSLHTACRSVGWILRQTYVPCELLWWRSDVLHQASWLHLAIAFLPVASACSLSAMELPWIWLEEQIIRIGDKPRNFLPHLSFRLFGADHLGTGWEPQLFMRLYAEIHSNGDFALDPFSFSAATMSCIPCLPS